MLKIKFNAILVFLSLTLSFVLPAVLPSVGYRSKRSQLSVGMCEHSRAKNAKERKRALRFFACVKRAFDCYSYLSESFVHLFCGIPFSYYVFIILVNSMEQWLLALLPILNISIVEFVYSYEFHLVVGVV
jgi:hypothetical protein